MGWAAEGECLSLELVRAPCAPRPGRLAEGAPEALPRGDQKRVQGPPGDWSDPALLRTAEILLRSHFTLVRCGREAPSLCFCPEPAVEGAVAMAPEGSARCSEMPGRLNAITHQVLCM